MISHMTSLSYLLKKNAKIYLVNSNIYVVEVMGIYTNCVGLHS